MRRVFVFVWVVLLSLNLVYAQDSIHVYEGGKVAYRQSIVKVDSITFPVVNTIFKGLVAKYPFNGNTNDVTGNGNDGVNYGASLTTDRFDNSNSAYYFDGYSHINCGNKPILNFTDSFTVCVWAKTNQVKDNCAVIGRWRNNSYDTSTEQYVLFYTNTTVQACVFTNGWVPLSYYAKTNFSYADNVWHFYSMSYDGVRTRLYIDGVLKSELSQPGKIQDVMNDLLIGYYAAAVPTGLNLHWVGKIDDIWIYNRALNIQEINSVYKSK